MASAPFFTSAPLCRDCGRKTARAITKPQPEPARDKGNTNRPFYKCKASDCGTFYCFDDSRGILDTNPACKCGRPSRRRVAGKASWDSSYLQVQCATAACDYSELELDESGMTKVVPRAEIPEWIRLGHL